MAEKPVDEVHVLGKTFDFNADIDTVFFGYETKTTARTRREVDTLVILLPRKIEGSRRMMKVLSESTTMKG